MTALNPSADILAAIRDRQLRNTLAANGSGFAVVGMGGSAFDYPPEMKADFADYFKRTYLIDQGYLPVGSGGKLSMVAEGQAVYWREGVEPFTIRPNSEMMIIANIDPAIGAAWEQDFPGFKVVRL